MLKDLFKKIHPQQLLSIGGKTINGAQIHQAISNNNNNNNNNSFKENEFCTPLTNNSFQVELSADLSHYLAFLCLLNKEKNIFITNKNTTFKDKIPFIAEFEKSTTSSFIGLSTSGSTGEPKTVLHDLKKLISLNNKDQTGLKFLSCVPGYTIGGISSFLWSLFSNADFFSTDNYNPDFISQLIENEQINTLSCPPTFLRFFSFYLNTNPHITLLSLKKILYGSEPMDVATLTRLSKQLPHVDFQQKYASSEFGFTPFKSINSQSIAFHTKSKSASVKIVENKIRLKAPHSFLGYLEPNISSPIDDEGYFITNDLVEFSADGSQFKVIGRDSEWAQLAGKKIHLRSLEEHGLKASFVLDCYVQNKPHILAGNILSMKALIATDFSTKHSLAEIRDHLRAHFLQSPSFKDFIPQEFAIEVDLKKWNLTKKTPEKS